MEDSAKQPLTNTNQNYGSTSTSDTSITIDNSETSPIRRHNSLIYNILFSSRVNILLIFVPFGILAHFLHLNDVIIFGLNFLAIIPLAKLLEFATDGVSCKVGQAIGGLLNATFGNAVELIVSIVALVHGELRVVQASVLGSIISNLLLVLGFCFMAGGFRFKEQEFNQTAAQTSSSLMALACIGLIIPAAFNSVMKNITGGKEDEQSVYEEVLDLSHGTALVLLVIYILYLYFQLRTHAHLFGDEKSSDNRNTDEENAVVAASEEDEESEDVPLSFGQAIFLLASVTLIVTISAEYLVGSLEGLVEYSGISKTFVGFILLPIVGNAAEHATAVSAAMKDKMNLSIAVAIGSSMQIALFVTPFLVLLGWIIGQPLSLFFQTFETVLLFISVFITSYLIQDGKSNWLEGAMLLATYAIISLACFIYPDVADSMSDDETLPNLRNLILPS